MIKQKVDQRYLFRSQSVASNGRLRSDIKAFEIIGHLAIWLVIVILTVGIGAVFFPYATAKVIIGSITVVDEFGRATGRLRCNLGFLEVVGHGFLSALAIVCTGGIAAPLYLFALAHFVLNRTELVSPSHP